MALYLISYDINVKDAFEYEGLWAELKSIKAMKILFSEWIVSAEVGMADSIYNKVAVCIQGKDRLLVQEVTSNAVWDKLLISDPRFLDLLQSARG